MPLGIYSIVVLRPKNKIKLPTQSAEKWICMGKWAFKILVELFLKNEKTSDDRTFCTQCVRYNSPGLKKFHQEISSRGEETIHKLKSKFSIFTKMAIIRLLTTTYFWAWSKFNIFANFDPLMANDGSLKLSQQGGFDLVLFVGGRHSYKNNNLV